MWRLLILMLFCFSANGQRNLTTVLDPAPPQQQNVLYNTRVLIAGHTDSFMLAYNDFSFSRYNYPVVSGTRLKFDSNKNPLTVYKGGVYLGLRVTPGSSTTGYLYRFNGTSFTNVAIAGVLSSNCAVYGDYMYFLARSAGTTKFYRFNGSTTVDLGAVPNSVGYQLHATSDYLYVSGYQSGAGTVNFIKRFNGVSFFTLPYTGPGANVDKVYQIPFTTQAYFTSHERIIYFNGTSVIQVFFNTGEGVFAKLWRNNLYFTTGVTSSTGVRTTYLYRLSGATLTHISLPGGAVVSPVPHSNPEVYGDRLYVGAVYPDASKRVLQYDGATFTPFFNITGSVGSGIALFVREGNLMIHPNFVNGRSAFEYNGSVFTEIIAPADRLLFPYINSTACNHLWLNYYNTAWGIAWAYAAESKCPPPPPAAMPVIPEHFRDYERFDMTPYGKDRGWCWSEIIIDWEIVPYCPLPPCPDPNYEFKMINANNMLAWSAKFNKPSILTVPLADQQAYRAVLASTDAQKDLVVFEPDLVPMGIASVTLNMKPKQNYFLLSATTRNNASVPMKASLLNANGAVIWEQNFTAPFSQQIQATVQEWGQKLVFSKADMITRTFGHDISPLVGIVMLQ